MHAKVKVGSFTRNASTGAQAVTGVGFQPKALVLWGTNQTATGFTDECYYCRGITDGTFAVAIVSLSGDNLATSDTHRSYEEGAIYRSIDSGGSLLARATFTSFDTDGFTITWATNDGVQSLINYLAIGGDGVSANAGVFDSNTVSGQQAITGVGFQPTALMTWGTWSTATSATSDFFSLNQHWTSGVGAEGACAGSVEDDAAAANTGRYQRSDKCIAAMRSGISGGIGDEYCAADLVSFDADGFTIDWTTPPVDGASVGIYYMALAGVRAKAGTLAQPTGTGERTISGIGFRPIGAVFQSVANTASSTPQSEMRFWYGATDGSAQRGIFIGDNDAADPTETVRAQIADKAIVLATPAATGASSTVDAAAELSSFTSDGFVLDWTSADATEREVLYLVFGVESSGRNLLTGQTNSVSGSDIVVAGYQGTMIGHRSVLLNLDGDAHVENGDGRFIVHANAIDLNADNVRVNGSPLSSGADPDLTYVTVDDETSDLANSRRLVAGTNITFNTGTAGQLAISASGGSGANVPDLLNSTKGSSDTPDAEFSGSISPFSAVDGSSGTVSLLNSTGSGLYDVSSRSGWVLMQVGTAVGDGVTLLQNYTLPDDACIVAPISFAMDLAATPANNEVWAGIAVNDDDDDPFDGASAQTVALLIDAQASGTQPVRIIGLDGTTVIGQDVQGFRDLYFLRISRSGLTYHLFWSTNGFSWTYQSSKTMGSAATNVWLFAQCNATMANRIIVGCPWFRQGDGFTPDPWAL